ncbi:MAG: hypothetical protein GY857_09655 [Desulfobacula sp.]|nr:hypothetical protein [Desulfobacula sp.]
MRSRFQNDERTLRELSYPTIRLYPEKKACIICNKKTNLLKTSKKDCYSYNLGKFRLIEGLSFCKDHKYVAVDPVEILKYHSQFASEIVERRFRVTIDMVVKVGLLRYRDNRQLEEVKAFLKYGSSRIDLPISTIGMISKRFLEYCELFHKKFEYKIKEDIKSNGGFVANFDGTTEKNSGVIAFAVRDSLSGHVLISEKVKSESYDEVTRILKKLKSKYGNPLTTISDLKPGFLSATQDSFNKKVPHKFCDYHFLRTFKGDFVQYHNIIRTCLCTTWKITSGLRKQKKSIQLSNDKMKNKTFKNFKDIETFWKSSKNSVKTYRLIIEWISKFKQASSGKGVPFDLPYLDLYDRLLHAKKLIDSLNPDKEINKSIREFNVWIEQIKNSRAWNPKFKNSIKMLTFSKRWFTKLRAILMLGSLQDKQDPLAPLSKKYKLTVEEATMIPKNIEDFLDQIETKNSSLKDPAKVEFMLKLRDKIKKYKKNLKIPIILLEDNGVETTILPSRTNNCLESFFRLIKALLRRNTGRSALTKEFASVGHLLPFYVYMKDHKTFKSIFEDEKKLTEEFMTLNKGKRSCPKK